MTFYAYEAYPSAYSIPVSIGQDTSTVIARTPRGERIGPAGDIRAFRTKQERDQWVAEGLTVIRNSYGYVVSYRARSAVTAERARRAFGSYLDDILEFDDCVAV